ncbi:MAG: hypothetical protein KDD35_12385, partial [Bdellovibrionales bacterium]|nr:hypothetical protein [Bdellovibrionales bacterium]
MKELTATERQEIEISLIIFNRYLKDYIINSDLSIIERSGLRIYILYKYGTSDFNKSKQKFLNDMKEKSNLIKTHSPLFHKIISDNLTMQKVLNGEDLLPVEESSLKQTLSTLYLFADFIENPWAEFNDVKLDFDTLLNGQQLVERIKQYVAINSEENEVIRHEASLKKTYGICKKSFSSHLVSRPNENQLKTVNQLISKVKSSAEGVAKKLFDTVSQEEIKTLTQGILFTLPSTQEEAPSQILKAIQALAKIASETGLKNFDELSDEETENILGLFVAITESETDEIDDEYSSVSDFCLKYIPESLSDSSVTVENRIFTSAKTVKAAMQGVGIIAHEAAHRLYRDLSGKPQAALLTCLKNRHFGSLS